MSFRKGKSVRHVKDVPDMSRTRRRTGGKLIPLKDAQFTSIRTDTRCGTKVVFGTMQWHHATPWGSLVVTFFNQENARDKWSPREKKWNLQKKRTFFFIPFYFTHLPSTNWEGLRRRCFYTHIYINILRRRFGHEKTVSQKLPQREGGGSFE